VKAIISDIHSNLEALKAVLDDIEKQSVTEIFCLGDVIGYGPNPRECIDLVMSCRVVLLGNHDQGALFDPDGFNRAAEMAIMWTRQQLELPSEARSAQAKRWEFLAERPRSHREDGYLYVHGSARNPLNEYVFPDDPRACYVLLDDDTIRFRRVEYDIETTVRKIYAIPELENFLGDRLREGR
jgi:hypothetical protein